MSDGPSDFSWYYFIGRNRLGLTFEEVGRITLRTFFKLYQCYKDTFDIEMRLKNSNTTYQELEKKQMEEEEWF